MSRFLLAASLVAALAVAACGAAAESSLTGAFGERRWVPRPEPSVSPPAPTPRPDASAPPPASPEPPAEHPEDFTVAERYLLDGVLRGVTDCAPAGGSDEMPGSAIAGIECASPDSAVFRIGFYLFENDADMLDAYLPSMKARGRGLDSGGCCDGEGEGAYTPGEGILPHRDGCFINDEGIANYRATLPGFHVSIGIYGRSGDTRALAGLRLVRQPGHARQPDAVGPTQLTPDGPARIRSIVPTPNLDDPRHPPWVVPFQRPAGPDH